MTRTEEIRAEWREAAKGIAEDAHCRYCDFQDQDSRLKCKRDVEFAVKEIVKLVESETAALREEVERLKGALEIAFVQGAQWWEWERTSFTMWGADRNRAEAEAAKLNAAGTLGMTYEERMKRARAALSPSPAQQEHVPKQD